MLTIPLQPFTLSDRPEIQFKMTPVAQETKSVMSASMSSKDCRSGGRVLKYSRCTKISVIRDTRKRRKNLLRTVLGTAPKSSTPVRTSSLFFTIPLFCQAYVWLMRRSLDCAIYSTDTTGLATSIFTIPTRTNRFLLLSRATKTTSLPGYSSPSCHL